MRSQAEMKQTEMEAVGAIIKKRGRYGKENKRDTRQRRRERPEPWLAAFVLLATSSLCKWPTCGRPRLAQIYTFPEQPPRRFQHHHGQLEPPCDFSVIAVSSELANMCKDISTSSRRAIQQSEILVLEIYFLTIGLLVVRIRAVDLVLSPSFLFLKTLTPWMPYFQ